MSKKPCLSYQCFYKTITAWSNRTKEHNRPEEKLKPSEVWPKSDIPNGKKLLKTIKTDMNRGD